MIRFVKKNQIDQDKYNQCIANALQTRIYAHTWYLDVVANDWSALILDDYDAVMPLPIYSKLGIKYISQPFFTQQLGVFSKQAITEDIFDEFLKNIPKRFFKIALQFNSENKFIKENSVSKNNYILPLDNEYNFLYKNFSKGRKHAIQQGIKNDLQIDEISFFELLELSKKHYSFKEISENEYSKLSKLVEVLKEKNKAKIIGVKVDDLLIGGAVFLIDAKRIVYLFSAVSNVGKEKQVASFLLNSMIEKYSNSNKLLDFEGSQIPGIASFFKSFGAQKETYFLLKKRLL